MKQTNTKMFLATLALLATGSLFAQNLNWVRDLGGNQSDDGANVVVDAAGNVYSIGMFEGTADFDPGAGTCMFTCTGSVGQRDIYISKLDASGNFLWAKQIQARSGNTYSYHPSIALDPNGGVVYSIIFRGLVDFDPGPATVNLTGDMNFDVAVSRLDAAGNFAWVKMLSGFATQVVCGLETDASGNIYTTGYFSDSTDFDPGPGTYMMGSTPGSFAAFAWKLNASGNLVWAKKMGGATSGQFFGDLGRAMALDATGNIYITGEFDGTEDFDPGAGVSSLTAPVMYQTFVLKLDNAGNFIWAGSVGGSSGTDCARANAIDVDGSGNVYYAGDFKGNCDFDPGAGTTALNAGSDSHIFISKLNASGNVLWAEEFTGTGQVNWAADLMLDAYNNIYITGMFQNTTMDFDPGPGTSNLTTTYTQAYISKLDLNGNYVWVKTFENGNTEGRGIYLDALGNLYTTGVLGDYWNVDFDPGPGVYTLPTPAVGYSDAYLVKLSPVDLGITEQQEISLQMFPNPANTLLTIQLPADEKMNVSLRAMNGALISRTTAQGPTLQIDVSDIANGVYLLVAENDNGILTRKLLVAH